MDTEHLRGMYVANGIALCIEPKRCGVKVKLTLENALGRKRFSKMTSFSANSVCWWHTENCLNHASMLISDLKNRTQTEREERLIKDLLTAVGLLF